MKKFQLCAVTYSSNWHIIPSRKNSVLISLSRSGRIGLMLLFALLMLAFANANAATKTSTGVGGDWHTSTTWSPSGVPAAGDDVIIASGSPVTTSGGNIACATLTINSAGVLTMYRQLTVSGATSITGTINFGSTAGTIRHMTFTGAVTLNAGAVWNETTTGAAATFSFGDSFTNNATTFTAQNTAHDFTGATKTIGGTTATVLPTVTFTGNYTVNSASTLTSSTLLTVTGAGVSLTNNGTINATAALSGSGGVTQGTTGVLDLGGTVGITTLTASASGNTVNYTGAAQAAYVTTYHHLTLSGSGAKTFATTPTVDGFLSMEGTATIIVNTGVVTYGAGATLQYNKPASYTATTEEWITPFVATGGIVIKNTGAITTPGAAQIGNGTTSVALNINGGATLTPGANLLTFYGDFTNSGTLTSGSGGVTIAGTAAQSIGGFTTTGTVAMTKTGGTATLAGNVNGAGLTINGAGGTLNLGSGKTHTFTGVVALTLGTLNGGNSTLNENFTGLAWTGTAGVFTPSLGTVSFGASGAQSIGYATTFNNLTINNASGVTLSSVDANVNATLTFANGIVTTGANYVIIGASGTVSGAAAGKYIYGKLRRYVPIAAAPTVGYDIGDATNYTPVSITFTGTGSGYLDASTAAPYAPPYASGLSQTKYINRKWTLNISSLTGFTDYSPTFTFVAGDEIGSPNTSSLIIKRNFSSAWNATTLGTQGALSTQCIVVSLSNGSNDFALGESACAAGTTVWLGTTSTDWNTASNWCSGAVPTSSENVEIPSGTPNSPYIATTGVDAVCNNLTIDAGATLTMDGTHKLTVSGNWNKVGSFVPSTGIVNFQGSFAQTITGATTIAVNLRNLDLPNDIWGRSGFFFNAIY